MLHGPVDPLGHLSQCFSLIPLPLNHSINSYPLTRREGGKRDSQAILKRGDLQLDLRLGLPKELPN